MHAVGVDLIGWKMPCDIFRNVGCEPVVLLPVEIMRGIGRVGDVDRINATGLLLRDTLEDSLCARTLHAYAYAWIFRLERLRQTLGDVEFQRRVER